MNRTYQYFNDWVYSYYTHTNRQSTQGTFAIDLQMFQKEHHVDSLIFPEIKFGNWSKLLSSSVSETGDRIPLYFGLIALQCHAAILMEHDGYESDKMYRSKFIKLTGVESVHSLDCCFRELYNGQPVQEVIWEAAHNHFKAIGIGIFLPQKHSAANRYVQFPKSQVVLNREDLKEYKPILRQLEEETPIVSFKDFKKILARMVPRYRVNFKRANNRRDDFSGLEKAIKDNQIFNFYCSDWENTYDRQTITKVREHQRGCIACVEDEQIELYDYNFEPFYCSELPQEKWLFFKQGDYPNEFLHQNKIEYECDFLICYPNGDDILKVGHSLIYHGGKAVFVKVNFTKQTVPVLLQWHIIDTYPLRIHGVRSGRSNTFISGVGVVIEVLGQALYSMYLGGHKLDGVPNKIIEIGNYSIRIAGFPDLNFRIIDFQAPELAILSSSTGRRLLDYQLSSTGNRMEGTLIFFDEREPLGPIVKTMPLINRGSRIPKNYNELKRKILSFVRYEED